MSYFLIRIFIILPVSYSDPVLAMFYPLEDDIASSKRRFLISGAPYNEKDQSKGVMTLCFTLKIGFLGIYEDAALVFEMFVPETSDVQVTMVHHTGNSIFWDDGNAKGVRIALRDRTLARVYRAIESDWIDRNEIIKYHPATYTRYASWVLPNENLLKGYNLASNDKKSYLKIFQDAEKQDPRNPKYDSTYEPIATGADKKLYKELSNRNYTSYHYVLRIMQEVGLKNVEFSWWWLNTDSNLKLLVDNHIKPAPTCSVLYPTITLPEFPAKKEK